MLSQDQMAKDLLKMSKGGKSHKAFYKLPKVDVGKIPEVTVVEPTQQQVSQAKEQYKEDIKRKRYKKKPVDKNPFQ